MLLPLQPPVPTPPAPVVTLVPIPAPEVTFSPVLPGTSGWVIVVQVVAAIATLLAAIAAAVSAAATRKTAAAALKAQERAELALSTEGRARIKITASPFMLGDQVNAVRLRISCPKDGPEARQVAVYASHDRDQQPMQVRAGGMIFPGQAISALVPADRTIDSDAVTKIDFEYRSDNAVYGYVDFYDEHDLNQWREFFTVTETASMGSDLEVAYGYEALQLDHPQRVEPSAPST